MDDQDVAILRLKYQRIYELLKREYGEPEWRQHLPPVDELVSTILSQSTSDSNRDKGFYALKERYPNWELVIDAPVEDIRDTIRTAGLANQKAPRIQNALRRVREESGEISLDFLNDMSHDEAMAWLVALPGVGPKTASIVLLFAFGRPAFPVDTHVHRLTKRLGLIGPKVSANKAHGLLESMGDADTYYAYHLNLIRHGRQVCQARNPRCAECFLQKECDYYQNLMVEDSTDEESA
jgi:endonuclease-3